VDRGGAVALRLVYSTRRLGLTPILPHNFPGDHLRATVPVLQCPWTNIWTFPTIQYSGTWCGGINFMMTTVHLGSWFLATNTAHSPVYLCPRQMGLVSTTGMLVSGGSLAHLDTTLDYGPIRAAARLGPGLNANTAITRDYRQTDRWGEMRADLMEQMLLELARKHGRQPSPRSMARVRRCDVLGQATVGGSGLYFAGEDLPFGMGLEVPCVGFRRPWASVCIVTCWMPEWHRRGHCWSETEIADQSRRRTGYDSVYFFTPVPAISVTPGAPCSRQCSSGRLERVGTLTPAGLAPLTARMVFMRNCGFP